MLSPYAQKIKLLGLHIPDAPKPAGVYLPVMIEKDRAYLSGQLSRKTNGEVFQGTLGEDLGIEEGKAAARLAAIGVISLIQNVIGYEKFRRILKMTGFVKSASKFEKVHEVLNGASELLADIFGDHGQHARAAVGVSSLPAGAAVELDVVCALKEGS